MYVPKFRTILLTLVASAGLAGCAYDDGYGYGGVSLGYGTGYYDPWYDDWYYHRYYPRSYYGWYDGFYYPGSGYWVYDRKGNRHRWSDSHRRHWEARRHEWRRDGRGDHEARQNWRDFRRERRDDPNVGANVGRDRTPRRPDFSQNRPMPERGRVERRQESRQVQAPRERAERSFTRPSGRGERAARPARNRHERPD